jgi:hypothetical protein
VCTYRRMGQSSRNEVHADFPSSVPHMMPYIVSGLCFLTSVYVTLLYTFRESSSILGLPRPADEFCPDSNTTSICSRSDLFAFQMTSWLALLFCGLLGFHTWHVTGRSHSTIPNTAVGRLFGSIPEAEKLAAACFTFQFFDFLVSLTIPEHRTAIMMTHHFMAASVSWFSIQFQYLHHYGVFYLGLSEVSSIFLVFVDLAKYFPPVPGSMFDRLVGTVCGPAFVVTFTLYRVIMWWPVSFQLFLDAYSVLKSGQASKLRHGKEWVLYVFLGMNLPLGILQLYWFGIIVEEVRKVF